MIWSAMSYMWIPYLVILLAVGIKAIGLENEVQYLLKAPKSKLRLVPDYIPWDMYWELRTAANLRETTVGDLKAGKTAGAADRLQKELERAQAAAKFIGEMIG